MMNPEFVPLDRAMREYTRERDSGPAGHIFLHKVVPAFETWQEIMRKAQMTEERLSPDHAMRLLRAKEHELENMVLNGAYITVQELMADIALLAGILANLIEDLSD